MDSLGGNGSGRGMTTCSCSCVCRNREETYKAGYKSGKGTQIFKGTPSIKK